MAKIITQIYEVQTPAEAKALIACGVDHIGSVLLSENQWRDAQIKATLEVVRANGARSSLIPLFSTPETIFQVLAYYRPDIVHFCEALGAAGPDAGTADRVRLQEAVRQRFPQVRIMRSIPIAGPGAADPEQTLALARCFEAVSDYFLTDTLLGNGHPDLSADQPVSGFVGITGEICDWNVAARLVDASRIPVILAGGISPDNVYAGIVKVRPAGVDSCTRTNARDTAGRPVRFKKDLGRVAQLIGEVRRAERAM